MIKVDARGEQCPIPVVKAKNAMKGMNTGEVLEVLVDNDIAVQNVTKMAGSANSKAVSQKVADNEFKITITVGSDAQLADETTPAVCVPDVREDSIVVLSSDKMGSGNDELGKVLMKGFIFALTQLETLPKTVLLYNGGAVLSSEGSDSLEDLKLLETQGVEILTCGTCLNYYELTDKLQVGAVTNMYTIVEKMAAAVNIIRP